MPPELNSHQGIERGLTDIALALIGRPSLSSNGWTGKDYGSIRVWCQRISVPSQSLSTTSRFISSSVNFPYGLTGDKFLFQSTWVGSYGGHISSSLQHDDTSTSTLVCASSMYTGGPLTCVGIINVMAVQFL